MRGHACAAIYPAPRRRIRFETRCDIEPNPPPGLCSQGDLPSKVRGAAECMGNCHGCGALLRVPSTAASATRRGECRARTLSQRVAFPRLVRPGYSGRVSETAVTPETLALRELVEARRDDFFALLEKYKATNPSLFGSVARGTAGSGSDIDILVEMDPADGNLLMRASGLLEETRELFGRDDIDVFPMQLLKRGMSASVLADAVPL